jgi:TrbL/VirB6 plasmid conjugal transfer protein
MPPTTGYDPIVIGLAQFAVLFVVSFGMIASAMYALLGPLFIPFFIVPTLKSLFWNWLEAVVQYSFMPVISNAFIFVFDRFQPLPANAAPRPAPRGSAALRRPHVMILVTFTIGVLLVPSFTSSIFSGRSGKSVLPGRLAW